jgi:DNA-binding NarL/FixJ family response regulator
MPRHLTVIVVVWVSVPASGYAAATSSIRSSLGDEEFQREAQRGSVLSWSEVVAEILHVLRSSESESSPDGGNKKGPHASVSTLTPREREVLGHLAGGLSNKKIAGRMGVTQKTVMHHTMAIYRKVGVSGRAQAAPVAVTSGMPPP